MSSPGLLLCVLLVLPFRAQTEQVVDWHKAGQDDLSEALRARPILNEAKNIILFIGDGLGISTITSSRVYNAQKSNKNFWEARLAFEKFPNSGLVHTYAPDHLVVDSSASATAYLTGEKARYGALGVKADVERGRCDLQIGNELKSVLKYAQEAGKRTGIVSTARITHATPAAAYASAADRDWETDANIPPEYRGQCKDIARQMIEDSNDINVFLGGGRIQMMPNTTADPEYPEMYGGRTDGRNLIEDWTRMMRQKFTDTNKYKFVQKLDEFKDVDPAKVDRLLGLFEPSHMQYNVDRLNTSKSPWSEPSISEMTEKALNIVKRGDKGYFLYVESGRIDHAHHDTNAFRALNDTMAFSEAIQKAVDMTDEKDTLILVSADHSHVFTIAGYSTNDIDIFGLAAINNGTAVTTTLGLDGLPYTTLGYANGPRPSFDYHYNHTGMPGSRRNLTDDSTSGIISDVDYLQAAGVPVESETHAGEDVPMYARGPHSHLVTGVHDQSYIAHLIMYAGCIGPSQGVRNFCKEKPDYKGWPMDPTFVDPASQKSGTGQFNQLPMAISLLLLSLFLLFKKV